MTQQNYDELYAQLTSHPTVGETGPPHAEFLMHAARQSNAKVIVEIGFNRGSSALSLLMSSDDCVVYSVDIRTPEEVRASCDFLTAQFPNRFHYIHGNSRELLSLLPISNADLVFIDGDHSYDGVRNDVEQSLQLNPRCIVFDDYYHGSHRHDIQRVIDEFQLVVAETSDIGCGQAFVNR